ncbi:MAG: hypothetical protein GTO00_09095 [Deltaproteobacteria bacterium]|nr:hypothetical protein [Deltaproteobacteria bacterium]
MLSKYRKLLVAVVGVIAILLGPTVLGVSPEGTIFGMSTEAATQLIVGILTAAGVWAAPNTEA